MTNSSPTDLVQASPAPMKFAQVRQSRLWLVLVNLHARFKEEHLGLTAGSLTFTTLISLVPLLTVMLALFTVFPMFSSFQVALEKYFLQNLIPANIARPVLTGLTQFAAKAKGLGSMGVALLGFTALALMLTIDRTLNLIWRVKRPRPIAQRVLVYWFALTLGPLILGGSIVLTSYAVTTGQDLLGDLPGNWSFFLSLVQVLIMAAAVSGLFHYVPNTHVRWRHAAFGGLFVALALSLAKWGLAWYLKHVPTYSTLYGAFAVVPVFLIWLYLGWVIVLIGAVLSANAPSLAGGMPRRPEAPGVQLELALDVLRALWRAQREGRGGLSSSALALTLRVDPLQLEAVLDSLVGLDWVGRLEEGGVQRLVLLCAPEQVPAQALLQATVAQRTPGLQQLWARSDWDRLRLVDLLEPASTSAV
ncbi:YihY family inner membrane protein [Paucibacter sp. KBW04]|uniref:YihY family inner membrane protein n=1 Tax=Paucibacter sp. KBW04 TaxID=2153361 RepID=UPI0018CC0B29|nr:YihY family inner membrane protein [Paucibacter sp. KBW04]